MAKDLEIVNFFRPCMLEVVWLLSTIWEDPVEVEEIVAQAGIDIGDTSIGMHVKGPSSSSPGPQKWGGAHVTALSRPKLVVELIAE